MSTILLVCILLLSPASLLADEQFKRIAIIGDDMSLGAAANPDFEFDAVVLKGILEGRRSRPSRGFELNAVSVLPPTPRFEFNGMTFLIRSFMFEISQRYFNSVDLSWGRFLKAESNVSVSEVLIAAENGARYRDVSILFQRILDSGKDLPDALFVFMAGNDFCVRGVDLLPTVRSIREELRLSLGYFARSARLKGKKMEVFLVSPLRVYDLISSQSILERSVRMMGRSTTCGQLLDSKDTLRVQPKGNGLISSFEEGYLTPFLPPLLPAMCPLLVGSPAEREKVVGALANRVRSLREEMPALALEVNSDQFVGSWLRVTALTGASEIEFTGEEIAHDCFHLSGKGQKRLASVIAQDLLNSKKN